MVSAPTLTRVTSLDRGWPDRGWPVRPGGPDLSFI
jgi:hypothetical protein